MDSIKKGFGFLINHIKTRMSDSKTSSRKYKLILMIFLAATLMCVLPPALSVFVFKVESLILLSGTQWVALMTTLVGFYYGANVVQKRIIKSDGTTEVNLNTTPSPSLPPKAEPKP